MKKVLVCKEKIEDETRVALIPDDIKKLISMGFEFKVVAGAGIKSGFPDSAYEAAGAVVVKTEEEAYGDSEIVVRILKPENASGMKEGTFHISYLDPFNEKALLKDFADKKIAAVSLEMIPRTTLAQKMDVQSSQTSLAGYVAVINAAARLPKILPMMVTPAGTINPARVFVIGVGVAGLQAIATAKRLGARVVHAERKGYGSALLAGCDEARGTYVIMGDADDSYDFLNLMPFLEKLREGYDLVMGDRFAGGIELAGHDGLVGAAQQVEGFLVEVLLVIQSCCLDSTLYHFIIKKF